MYRQNGERIHSMQGICHDISRANAQCPFQTQQDRTSFRFIDAKDCYSSRISSSGSMRAMR